MHVARELANRGIKFLSIKAAAAYNDVEMRINCAGHLQAGRLLDILQTNLQSLKIDIPTVKEYWYAVRSEFLAQQDKLIYRIWSLMLPESETGYAAMSFRRLQAQYKKAYGGGVAPLKLEDIRGLDLLTVTGDSEEEALVELASDTVRKQISRYHIYLS
jgi:hypothetical protein